MSQSWEPGNVGDPASGLDHKGGEERGYCDLLTLSIAVPLSVCDAKLSTIAVPQGTRNVKFFCLCGIL